MVLNLALGDEASMKSKVDLSTATNPFAGDSLFSDLDTFVNEWEYY
jgi:hypothetical protein